MSNIEPLGPAAIDRVIDANSAKILSILGVPLVEESPAFRYQWNYTNPVPVWNDDGVRIGHATLYRQTSMEPGEYLDYHEEAVLKADLFIDYATPERLTIELGEVPLYASIEGDLRHPVGITALHLFSPKAQLPVEAIAYGVWITTVMPKSVQQQRLSIK